MSLKLTWPGKFFNEWKLTQVNAYGTNGRKIGKVSFICLSLTKFSNEEVKIS